MKTREFLGLVGVFEIDDTDPHLKEKGGFHLWISLDNFLEVMQKNGLEVKNRKITAWGLADDLSKYSGFLGVDEAHDIIAAWCREYGIRKDDFPPKTDKTKPLCHPEPECEQCESDTDCGGQDERPKKTLENWETSASKEEIDAQYRHGLK